MNEMVIGLIALILLLALFTTGIELGFAIVNTNVVPLFEFVFIPFTYGPLKTMAVMKTARAGIKCRIYLQLNSTFSVVWYFMYRYNRGP